MAGTTINMTSVQPNGKEVKKSINYVNPNASNSNVSNFVVALNGLSNNTLTGIEKVTKTDLEITTPNQGE